MKIELKWDNFKYPSIEEVRKINKTYPDIDNFEIKPIESVLNFINNKRRIIDFSTSPNQKIYEEQLLNHISISSFYLTNVLCYLERKPLRFKDEERTINSLLFETNYEMFYLKLYGAFDRYLHIVNIMFNLSLSENEVTKFNILKKLEDHFPELYKNFEEEIIKNTTLNSIAKIRNTFIHRTSDFEKKTKTNNKKEVYDKYPYRNKSTDAITHFSDYIKLINEKAIPFLYETYFTKKTRQTSTIFTFKYFNTYSTLYK